MCEFRGRLSGGDAVERLLARLLDAARKGGLLKARGRQRTDSTHVLAAVREPNRVELRLMVPAETAPANVHEAMRVEPIHQHTGDQRRNVGRSMTSVQ